MFKWWNRIIKVHNEPNYPSIKVAVKIGDIMLLASSVEELKEVMKSIPPITGEQNDN